MGEPFMKFSLLLAILSVSLTFAHLSGQPESPLGWKLSIHNGALHSAGHINYPQLLHWTKRRRNTNIL